MNKRQILTKIIDQLRSELELYRQAARAAHAEATHEQSKAENKYDTRGLEASYLARGQSRQAAEMEDSLAEFQRLDPAEAAPGSPVEVGCLVELSRPRERAWYFVGPRAGGTEVEHRGREITVVTPASPLGSRLLGRRAGDPVILEQGPAKTEYRIQTVL